MTQQPYTVTDENGLKASSTLDVKIVEKTGPPTTTEPPVTKPSVSKPHTTGPLAATGADLAVALAGSALLAVLGVGLLALSKRRRL
ncbi:hypothetical protein GCM10009659_28930 [Leucobacter albus]